MIAPAQVAYGSDTAGRRGVTTPAKISPMDAPTGFIIVVAGVRFSPASGGRQVVEQEIKRILIVEGHKAGRDALRMVLEFSGHTVRTAADGKRALAIARAWKPDVICLDLMIPEMNGYEVAAQVIKALGDERPLLVATTGLGSDVHRRKAIEAGFDAYILKPYDLDALLELIKRATAAPAADTPQSRRQPGGGRD